MSIYPSTTDSRLSVWLADCSFGRNVTMDGSIYELIPFLRMRMRIRGSIFIIYGTDGNIEIDKYYDGRDNLFVKGNLWV